jgi:glycosyltransferase involved in cell wall biosynthesis
LLTVGSGLSREKYEEMMQDQGMPASTVRVLGTLVGDIRAHVSGAQIKYGQLFAELAGRCHVVDVADVELRSADRYQNALHSFRWSKRRWREAFHKNIWAFHRRSQLAQQAVAQQHDGIDVVLQHGAIFWSGLPKDGPPVVIYTDFTYQLAAREDPWRNPFRGREARRWDELERQCYQQAAMTLTRSEYTRQSIIHDYGVPPERVAVVGGGVNFEELPAPMPLADTPRVLFIGKEFERKGGGQLVAAFRQVRERMPDAELWLVTANQDIAGPGIRCIAPTHDRDAIAALYRQASVFAMPSRCETWGDVFLEAMAYGLPCIGSTNDAMPEIIQHGETGFVVDADDFVTLAGYLEQLLGDPWLRRRMGEQGRARVAEAFTWAHVAQRIDGYLRHVGHQSLLQAS